MWSGATFALQIHTMATRIPSNRPWTETEVPESVLRLPRMLSVDERRYLVWLTETRYEGWGRVLDLGCWLGSSSACLAEGLRRSGRPGVVGSMDLFVWDAGYMSRGTGIELPDGSDFLPRFVDLTSPWRDRIEPMRVNLLDHEWNGGPVEILFVDAAKSWRLANSILRTFAAAIVPRRTRVVFQDFRMPNAQWLPLLVGSREDLWRELENTVDGTTVTFEAIRDLTGAGGLETHHDVDSFAFGEAERILRLRMQRDPDGRHLYARTILRSARLWGTDADVERARAELAALTATAPDLAELAEIEDVSAEFLMASWAAHERGDQDRAIQLAHTCLRRAPGAVLALAPLGCAHLAKGEIAEAATALEGLLQKVPERQDHHLYVADLRTRQGRYEEALRILEDIVPHLAPDEIRANHVLMLLTRIADQGRRYHDALRVGGLAPAAVRALPRWERALSNRASP